MLGGLIAVSLLAGLPVQPIYAQNNQSFADLESSRGYPVRGTSEKAVLAKYGEPQVRKGPVGKPPISTWEYAGFSVYFEGNLVITTVTTEDHLPEQLKQIQ